MFHVEQSDPFALADARVEHAYAVLWALVQLYGPATMQTKEATRAYEQACQARRRLHEGVGAEPGYSDRGDCQPCR